MSRNNLVPIIQWYQSESYVYMEIMLNNTKNNVIDISNESFLFECDKDNKHYLVCFKLFDNIVENMSSHKITDRSIKITIKKEDEDNEWSRLLKNKELYKNQIKYDWDKFDIEDEPSDEYGGGGMPNMDMMNMMGGGGGMPNMDMMKMMQMMGGGGEEGGMPNMDMMEMMKMMNGGNMPDINDENVNYEDVFNEESGMSMLDMNQMNNNEEEDDDENYEDINENEEESEQT